MDDEESVRRYFQQVLANAGYDVRVARDGSIALQAIRERSFDLLLTDLVMPEREGLELIMILRKERPDLLVIAISGAFGGAFLEAAKALGANAVLLKPVSPDQLLGCRRTIAETRFLNADRRDEDPQPSFTSFSIAARFNRKIVHSSFAMAPRLR